MSECDVEEEIDYDSLSVDELFAQGKLLFKERKYAESAEYFSRALERKSRDNPTDASLREYYLWFADSLLTKEEQTSTIFSNAVNEATTDDNLPTAESVLNAANNDESLAFELFSIGHECYTNYLNELVDVPEKEVLDASYCLTRLGDMYFTNNQFNEAAKEYGKALELREKYKLDLKYLAPLYISLAQSQMFNGQLNVSLTTFNKCKEVLESILSRKDLEGDKLNDMKNTLEDIIIQIGDLKKIMEKVATSSNGTNIKGSQCNAGDYVPKTTGTLDEKRLDPSVKSKVIDIGAGTVDGKRRRIDLSAVYNDKN